MIGYALLAGGSAGALVVAWQLAPAYAEHLIPAGRGVRRYTMTHGQLRRENAELMCALTAVSNDRDNAVRSALAWKEAAQVAGELIDEARAAKELRATVTALRAELANARPIRPLLADRAQEDTLPHGIAVVADAAFATTNPGRFRA